MFIVYNYPMEEMKIFKEQKDMCDYLDKYPANKVAVFREFHKLPEPISGFLDINGDFVLLKVKEDTEFAVVNNIPLIHPINQL